MNIRKPISAVAAALLALLSGMAAFGAGSPNTPPTISIISDQTIARNGVLATSFTVDDAETSADSLSVSATSSNMELLSDTSIILSGSGFTRNLAVIPMSNQIGQTAITITVTDEQGLSASITFSLRVGSDSSATDGNTPPGITPLGDVAVDDLFPASFALNVSDAESPPESLIVSGGSSNQAVVPDENILIGRIDGAGNLRGSIVPWEAAKSGSARITITVEDPQGLSASTAFTFTLITGNSLPPNAPPLVSAIPDQTTVLNGEIAVPFTVADSVTPTASLVFGVTSDNPGLFPDGSFHFLPIPPQANMILKAEPAKGEHGTAIVSVTVADESGLVERVQFTVTVNEARQARGDFDGDGNADILFQDVDGFLAVWMMNGFSLTGARLLAPNNVGDPAYRAAGLGHFDPDGRDDIVFQREDGTLAVWRMNGPSLVAAELLNPATPGDRRWRVVGVADANRDGKSDLFFQHADGTLAVWIMDGVNLASASLISPANPGDPSWRVAGVADFNGDAGPDLLFQHQDGTLALWLMNGLSLASARLLDPTNPGDSAWRVAGTIDLNRDGKPDLLFQNSRDNSLAGWLMDGVRMTAAGLLDPISPGGTWKAVAR